MYAIEARFCVLYPVLSGYTEPEADDLPLNEDGMTILSPGDDPEGKARKEVRRKFLERQRSEDIDRKSVRVI